MRCLGLDRKKAIEVTCPCGAVFEAQPNVLKKPGCGRYCSKACMYRYRTRPNGLTYNIVKDNPTWYKSGERSSPETEFQPGHQTWNKGIPTGVIPLNAFEPGNEPWNKGTSGVMPSGPEHHSWRGDEVGYHGLHVRVRQERGPAAGYPCQHADDTCSGPIDWANISHEYRDTQDFMPLCRSHHFRYDRASGAWGAKKLRYEG